MKGDQHGDAKKETSGHRRLTSARGVMRRSPEFQRSAAGSLH
ncbi:hypothetical protein I314_04352 [Cryptococcus bacillisporus CA1873]|uniref:Uncharacterized protein n=1 Tax=Cryptococcus bacillisporus CA1873 TaxID=1296111 RepID=A0ABR5B9L9_CRYGA|nr:hypothetical protein I314_04352 [Cryptococcus bacillisporus CA1873]|eukprot:KIR59917.1 hypothetical protein I314_04352 [Cryptococcus gattii CA1873]